MKEDQDTQLQIKEMEHTMAKYQRDSKDAVNKVRKFPNCPHNESKMSFCL